MRERKFCSPADWEQNSHKTLLSQTMRKTEDLLENKVRGETGKGLNRKGQQVRRKK